MKKYQSTCPYFRFKDEIYKVNAMPGMPIFTHQMRKTIEQLENMQTYHRKVLVLVFNLHLPINGYTADNKVIARLFSKIRYGLSKLYGMKRLGYAWCRERKRSLVQHYHVALMLNGSKIQFPDKLLDLLANWWSSTSNGGHLHTPKNCYYMLQRNEESNTKADIVYRLSYLAKVNTKQSREGLTNDYGTSQLKLKSDQ